MYSKLYFVWVYTLLRLSSPEKNILYWKTRIINFVIKLLFLKTEINCETFIAFGWIIVFVWSQYDGANIEQRIIGYGLHQNQEAKLKIVGGDM